jgi:hypothetical protein
VYGPDIPAIEIALFSVWVCVERVRARALLPVHFMCVCVLGLSPCIQATSWLLRARFLYSESLNTKKTKLRIT